MTFTPWVPTVGNLPLPLPVADLAPGANGQIINTTGGAVAWGSNLAIQAYLAGLQMPTGGLAETFPRVLAVNSQAQPTTIAKFGLITLIAGQVITSIHTIVATAGSGITNGWHAIADTNFNCLAVTANQTTAWNGTGDVAVALTSQYTVPTTGAYYFVTSATGTTIPAFATGSGATNLSAFSVLPVVTGNRGAVTSPPAVSTTIGSSTTVNALNPVYAYLT